MLSKITPKYWLVLQIGLFLIVFIFPLLYVNSRPESQTNEPAKNFFVALGLVYLVSLCIFIGYKVYQLSKPSKHARSPILEHWAKRNGFFYSESGNVMKHISRLSESPEKHFFNADIEMGTDDDVPFAEGNVRGRKVWIYQIIGKSPSPIFAHDTRTHIRALNAYRDTTETHAVFYAWCIEFSIRPVPVVVTFTKKKMGDEDVIDTESNQFEKTYDISRVRDSSILQLIDPSFMSLMLDANPDAVEISDKSLVLYHANPSINYDILDRFLEYGPQLAQQIERNFPMQKYAITH